MSHTADTSDTFLDPRDHPKLAKILNSGTFVAICVITLVQHVLLDAYLLECAGNPEWGNIVTWILRGHTFILVFFVAIPLLVYPIQYCVKWLKDCCSDPEDRPDSRFSTTGSCCCGDVCDRSEHRVPWYKAVWMTIYKELACWWMIYSYLLLIKIGAVRLGAYKPTEGCIRGLGEMTLVISMTIVVYWIAISKHEPLDLVDVEPSRGGGKDENWNQKEKPQSRKSGGQGENRSATMLELFDAVQLIFMVFEKVTVQERADVITDCQNSTTTPISASESSIPTVPMKWAIGAICLAAVILVTRSIDFLVIQTAPIRGPLCCCCCWRNVDRIVLHNQSILKALYRSVINAFLLGFRIGLIAEYRKGVIGGSDALFLTKNFVKLLMGLCGIIMCFCCPHQGSVREAKWQTRVDDDVEDTQLSE